METETEPEGLRQPEPGHCITAGAPNSCITSAFDIFVCPSQLKKERDFQRADGLPGAPVNQPGQQS
jgi:hypothetical protein